MRLRVAVHNQVKSQYVLNDVCFASADNMKFVKQQLKKEFVMPRKENRKVALSGDQKKRGQYVAVSTLALEPRRPDKSGSKKWTSRSF
jgi:hypothetical protein